MRRFAVLGRPIPRSATSSDQQIVQDINWARKTLGKNDRIVWFLRWAKLWYQLSGGIWAGGKPDASLSGALQQQVLKGTAEQGLFGANRSCYAELLRHAVRLTSEILDRASGGAVRPLVC